LIGNLKMISNFDRDAKIGLKPTFHAVQGEKESLVFVPSKPEDNDQETQYKWYDNEIIDDIDFPEGYCHVITRKI
jgi:hypothetical protein